MQDLINIDTIQYECKCMLNTQLCLHRRGLSTVKLRIYDNANAETLNTSIEAHTTKVC